MTFAPDPWIPRLLAVALGTIVGLVGTAFRLGAEAGYAAFAARVHAPSTAGVPGFWLGIVGSAVLVVAAVGLTRRLSPEGAGSGIQEIEGVLAGTRPTPRWKRILPVKFLGGLAAMSSGLILGREGPTIHMGGAIGAAIASTGPRARRHEGSLVGAGSAAGLSVAFNAPLGGILFAMEELRREFPMDSPRAQCVVIASITAVLVSIGLAGPVLILPIPVYAAPTLTEIALTLPFSILVAAYGVFFNAALVRSLDAMRTLVARIGWIAPALVLGSGIGLLLTTFPELTGGGETLSVRLFESAFPLGTLALLLVLRSVVFNASYSGGTPGGIFAPQLAFGAILGLLFAGVLQQIFPALPLEPGRFAVAGMAALLTATVRAPLTGLALVIEMTGNLALLPMALVASVGADLAAERLGGRPIYEVLLERALSLRESEAQQAGAAQPPVRTG